MLLDVVASRQRRYQVHVRPLVERRSGQPDRRSLGHIAERGLVHFGLSLRANTNAIHLFNTEHRKMHIGRHRLCRHLAVRFGRGTAEDPKQIQREGQVRAAYNSPFWPFVLASTSVGQEGLGFHVYSHAMVH
jgi:hypothetical protein